MTQPKPATISKEQLEWARSFVGCLNPENLSPELEDAFRALIAMAEPIAAGTHVVVPIEPTEAMQSAGLTMWANSPDDDDFICTHIYRAMIAAATENEKTAPK